jgi:glycerol uptake facilitator-like aquaporin
MQVMLAEAVGTAGLLAVVIGSDIMGERLSGGNVAIALLANTLATIGGFYVLIEVFGPVSGAHCPSSSGPRRYAPERANGSTRASPRPGYCS